MLPRQIITQDDFDALAERVLDFISSERHDARIVQSSLELHAGVRAMQTAAREGNIETAREMAGILYDRITRRLGIGVLAGVV